MAKSADKLPRGVKGNEKRRGARAEKTEDTERINYERTRKRAMVSESAGKKLIIFKVFILKCYF